MATCCLYIALLVRVLGREPCLQLRVESVLLCGLFGLQMMSIEDADRLDSSHLEQLEHFEWILQEGERRIAAA